MRRFKSFKTPLLNADDPVEFEIHGETFRCKKELQGVTLLEFVSASSSDDFGRSAEGVLQFIDSCLMLDERERFAQMTTSEDKIITMEMITDLAGWLVEVYGSGDSDSGKDSPGTESSPSSNGQTATTSSSEVEQLPAA